jgi:hypothetical protein
VVVPAPDEFVMAPPEVVEDEFELLPLDCAAVLVEVPGAAAQRDVEVCVDVVGAVMDPAGVNVVGVELADVLDEL